jgi:hypothetical protein
VGTVSQKCPHSGDGFFSEAGKNCFFIKKIDTQKTLAKKLALKHT